MAAGGVEIAQLVERSGWIATEGTDRAGVSDEGHGDWKEAGRELKRVATVN